MRGFRTRKRRLNKSISSLQSIALSSTLLVMLSAFFLLQPSALLAQSGRRVAVRGFIRENISRETLPGAQVVIPSTTIGTSSNNYGYYSLLVPKGEVRLRYSYVGYTPVEVTLHLERDTVLDISLTEEEIEASSD